MDQEDDMWLFCDFYHERSELSRSDSQKSMREGLNAIDQYLWFQKNQAHQQMHTPSQINEKQSETAIIYGNRLRNRVSKKIKSSSQYQIIEVQSRKKKKPKPSPYHNYQKHLTLALRHMLLPPTVTQSSSNIVQIAYSLWKIFINDQHCTKKILHFILNQQVEHKWSEEELKEFGFDELYQNSYPQEIYLARSFLAQLMLEQLSDDRIDSYLQTRRIKNKNRFRDYIIMFRHELEEGSIKNRFTAKSKATTLKLSGIDRGPD